MNRRRSLACVGAGVALIAFAYLWAFVGRSGDGTSAWMMVMGITLLSVGLILLGAWRPARRSALFSAAVALVAVALPVGFGIPLWLSANESTATTLVLGFPVRAAMVLYVVGILPLVILPVVYALTFDALTLSDDDLANVRRAGKGMYDA